MKTGSMPTLLLLSTTLALPAARVDAQTCTRACSWQLLLDVGHPGIEGAATNDLISAAIVVDGKLVNTRDCGQGPMSGVKQTTPIVYVPQVPGVAHAGYLLGLPGLAAGWTAALTMSFLDAFQPGAASVLIYTNGSDALWLDRVGIEPISPDTWQTAQHGVTHAPILWGKDLDRKGWCLSKAGGVAFPDVQEGSCQQCWEFKFSGEVVPCPAPTYVRLGETEANLFVRLHNKKEPAGRKYLSVNPTGTVVDLWTADDSSGRQMFMFESSTQDASAYTIKIDRGLDVAQSMYLTGRRDSAALGLTDSPTDPAGLQLWRVYRADDLQYFKIELVSDGRGTARVLSATDDGGLDLRDARVGDQRQLWEIQPVGKIPAADIPAEARLRIRQPMVNVGTKFLSVPGDGSRADLHAIDDGSGRQRWKLERVTGDVYSLAITQGVPNDKRYLSASSSGRSTALGATVGALQKWRVLRHVDGSYTISLSRPLDSRRQFLGVDESGQALLFASDEGTGRQRWYLDSTADAGTEWSAHAALIVSAAANLTKGGIMSVPPSGDVVDLFNANDGSGRQLWRINPLGNSLYSIRIVAGTEIGRLFLTLKDDGTHVELAGNVIPGRGQWIIKALPNSAFTIEPATSTPTNRKYLSTDGSRVDAFTSDDGSGRQHWYISPYSQDCLFSTNNCLDYSKPQFDARTNPGHVSVWKCNGEPQQRWRLEGESIVSRNESCLTIDARGYASQHADADVSADICRGTVNQRWKLTSEGYLVSPNGACLEVAPSDYEKVRDDGRVQAAPCDRSSRQRWLFADCPR